MNNQESSLQRSDLYGDVYKTSYPEMGSALIINIRNFRQHLRLPDREGSDRDISNIYQALSGLGFNVLEILHDATKANILQKMDDGK